MSSVQTQRPVVYQINTLVWLNSLSRRYGRSIHLGTIPAEVIAELAEGHFNFVWLMGIWHRGDKCRTSALNYIHEYRGALPDVTNEDIVGSAYAIGAYRIDRSIGGKRGLETFRRQLLQHGIKLMLDYVPNHVGLDHPWISQHPEYFVQGTPDTLARESGNFFRDTDINGNPIIIAHGRDPHFSGWIDTAQLNIFSTELRAKVIETLTEIATMCDAVRCDMAMLMTNSVFMRTWGWLGVHPLEQEYWMEIIPAIKQQYPEFLFIAEVYWDMEYEMLQQGFDYTYDKILYDHAVKHNYDGIHHHFLAEITFLERNIRFIENHDEPRAAAALGVERSKVFAALITTVPGAVLLHDGQFTGRKVKLPVQITRQPDEPADAALAEYYRALLKETSHPIYRKGQWTLFARRYAPGGANHQQVIAYVWQSKDEMRLIVLNTGEPPAQAIVDMSVLHPQIVGKTLVLKNILSGNSVECDGDSMAQGWRVELTSNQVCIYHVTMTPHTMKAHVTQAKMR